MGPTVLLVIYCIIILAASLAGGWLPMIITLTHRRLELVLSFVSGVMLGIALLHMLPHAMMQYQTSAAESAHGNVAVMWWVLGGFLGIFLLERFFPFHHHEPPGLHSDPQPDGRHDHDQDHDHGERRSMGAPSRLSWPAALFGFAVHSIIAGLALGATVRIESTDGIALAGVGVFLVIALHKPFDSLAIGTLMAARRSPHSSRHVVNTAFGLMVPLGVALYLGLERSSIPGGPLLGAVLALASGVFLCIALSDVLPELQFHRHDRVKLSIALVLGLAVAGVVAQFEAQAHQHDPGHVTTEQHDASADHEH